MVKEEIEELATRSTNFQEGKSITGIANRSEENRSTDETPSGWSLDFKPGSKVKSDLPYKSRFCLNQQQDQIYFCSRVSRRVASLTLPLPAREQYECSRRDQEKRLESYPTRTQAKPR
jgi:hypothetical protein